MKPKPKRATPKTKTRVLLVDDHPLVRQGMICRLGLEKDIEVCAEAGSRGEAMQAIAQSQPDLAIVDISLEDGSGLELIKDIKAQYPTLPILVLSVHEETLYAERALHAGAGGYVMKRQPLGVFLEAMRQVLRGETYVSEQLKARIIGFHLGRPERVVHSPVELLSDRELEVFELMGNGLATREIARRLKLSMKTVSCYRQNAKSKLRLKDGSELVRYAINWVANMNVT
ncbi:MAG TPA: response regulator transcription factor [Verrucomicrobiae bacterium]|nr:response regulator transcription factor [Verrucomicrobiae bacterium]